MSEKEMKELNEIFSRKKLMARVVSILSNEFIVECPPHETEKANDIVKKFFSDNNKKKD